jgi:hypothetical protein
MGRELQNIRVPGGSDMLTELKAKYGSLRGFLDRNPESFSTQPDPFESKAFVISLAPSETGAVAAAGVAMSVDSGKARSVSPTQQRSTRVVHDVSQTLTDSEGSSSSRGDTEEVEEDGEEGDSEDDQSDGSALVNGKPRSTLQYRKYMGRDAAKDRRAGTVTGSRVCVL